MSSQPYIVETAVLLLLALVLGGLVGFWARRWLKPGDVADAAAIEQPQAAAAEETAVPPVVEKLAPPSDVEPVAETDAEAPGKPLLLESARNDAADDLKKIKGVGPKIEKTLNGLGVFHYDQIVAWDEAAVAWVDEKLSFRGRITREDWVPQARALAAEKGSAGDA